MTYHILILPVFLLSFGLFTCFCVLFKRSFRFCKGNFTMQESSNLYQVWLIDMIQNHWSFLIFSDASDQKTASNLHLRDDTSQPLIWSLPFIDFFCELLVFRRIGVAIDLSNGEIWVLYHCTVVPFEFALGGTVMVWGNLLTRSCRSTLLTSSLTRAELSISTALCLEGVLKINGAPLPLLCSQIGLNLCSLVVPLSSVTMLWLNEGAGVMEAPLELPLWRGLSSKFTDRLPSGPLLLVRLEPPILTGENGNSAV